MMMIIEGDEEDEEDEEDENKNKKSRALRERSEGKQQPIVKQTSASLRREKQTETERQRVEKECVCGGA